MKKETSFIHSRLRNSQLAALPLAGGLFVAPAVPAEDYGQRSRYEDREYEPRDRDREDDYGRRDRGREEGYGRREQDLYEDRNYNETCGGRVRMSERDLRSFEGYLDSHDETAQLLHRNPDLINDRSSLSASIGR